MENPESKKIDELTGEDLKAVAGGAEESIENPSPEPPKVLSESDLEKVVGGTKGDGKVTHSDFTITKPTDLSSPS